MRNALIAVMAALTFTGGISVAPVADAQPRHRPGYGGGYGGGYRPPAPPPGQYYYNGRWVDQNDWRDRRDRDWDRRDRWDRRYRRDRRDNDGQALAAGLIGFALGAAIIGSQQERQKAYDRRGDTSHIGQCRARYRSYDASSDTYLGNDGYRHYCKL